MPTLDITEVIAEWGAKYVNEGQTARDIHVQVFEQDDFSSLFTKIPESDEVYKSAYSSISSVLQAFSIPFTPKGQATFVPWEQRLGEFKIDDTMVPDNFRKSWLGFLAEFFKDPDRSKWGIIEWFIRQLIIPKSKEEFFQEAAFYGWQYNGFAGTPTVDGSTFVRQLTNANNPTPANASVDGIHTQLAKMNAAGRLNVIAMGAPPTNAVEFCTYIEEMVRDESPKALRKQCDVIVMSDTLKNRFRDGKREKYNLHYKQEENIDLVRDTQVLVYGTDAMAGSNTIWMTPKRNRIAPTRPIPGKMFDVQKLDRSVKILGDYSFVNTFDVPEYIITNDQGMVIDSTLITARYTE